MRIRSWEAVSLSVKCVFIKNLIGQDQARVPPAAQKVVPQGKDKPRKPDAK